MQKLIFEGEGHANRSSIPGDVIVTIKSRIVPGWTRVGDDLLYNMKISFKEAIFGFDRMIGKYHRHIYNFIDLTHFRYI